VKLKFIPDPTFQCPVNIPVPGKEEVPVVFTFKYRTRDESARYREEARDYNDVQVIMSLAEGWELDEEFNEANVEALCNTYPSMGLRVLTTYFAELMGARQKN